MNLIEVKILYNADHIIPRGIDCTIHHIEELIYWVNQRPDVIRVSKTNIAEGGGDEEE